MNAFLGFIALIVSTYLGYCFSKKFDKRKSFYLEFNEFNKKIKNEISYSQNTIYHILNLKNKNQSDFYNCVTSVIINKLPFNFDKNYISLDEKDYFNDYILNIGNGDRVSQLDFLASTSEYLKEKCKSSDEEVKKYKKLYVKLGFLIGLIIFIVLI